MSYLPSGNDLAFLFYKAYWGNIVSQNLTSFVADVFICDLFAGPSNSLDCMYNID